MSVRICLYANKLHTGIKGIKESYEQHICVAFQPNYPQKAAISLHILRFSDFISEKINFMKEDSVIPNQQTLQIQRSNVFVYSLLGSRWPNLLFISSTRLSKATCLSMMKTGYLTRWIQRRIETFLCVKQASVPSISLLE